MNRGGKKEAKNERNEHKKVSKNLFNGVFMNFAVNTKKRGTRGIRKAEQRGVIK